MKCKAGKSFSPLFLMSAPKNFLAMLGLLTLGLLVLYQVYLSNTNLHWDIWAKQTGLENRFARLVADGSQRADNENFLEQTAKSNETVRPDDIGSKMAVDGSKIMLNKSHETISTNSKVNTSVDSKMKLHDAHVAYTGAKLPPKVDYKQEQKQDSQIKTPEIMANVPKKAETKNVPAKSITDSKPIPAGRVSTTVNDLATKGKKDTKYLVYLCQGRRNCGGWGDRQRGLTSLYLLARLIKREFKIIMTEPCDVTRWYAPAKVPWIPTKEELNTSSKITLDGFRDRGKVFQTIAYTPFNTVYNQTVVFIQTNRDFYYQIRHNPYFINRVKKWNMGDTRLRFLWAWRDLMKPTEQLLTHVEEQIGPNILIRKGLTTKPLLNIQSRNFSNDIGDSRLICAHVRLGKNPTMPVDGKTKYRLEDVPRIFDFMASLDDGNSRFFVATDGDEVRSRALKFFGKKAVGYIAHIIHIDRQRGGRGNPCEGFEQALAEQLILSLCDSLVVFSYSGFSRYAVYSSTNSTTIYRSKNDKGRVLSGADNLNMGPPD